VRAIWSEYLLLVKEIPNIWLDIKYTYVQTASQRYRKEKGRFGGLQLALSTTSITPLVTEELAMVGKTLVFFHLMSLFNDVSQALGSVLHNRRGVTSWVFLNVEPKMAPMGIKRTAHTCTKDTP